MKTKKLTPRFRRNRTSSASPRLPKLLRNSHRSLLTFTLATLAFILFPLALFSQTPQGFNYQAVVRDANGRILGDQQVGLRISILQGSENGTVAYSETHTVTTTSQGLVAVVVGKGTVETGDFKKIDWNTGPWYLKVEADVNGGRDYKTLGVSALMSVPYALQAGTVGSLTRLNIQGDDVVSDSALFEVKRKDGQPVFSVYNDSVVVHVNDAATKGPRGGFIIGGFVPTKGGGQDYLRVTPDSVRIYLDESNTKGPRGGFAIGGFGPLKGETKEYFKVSTENDLDVINPSQPRILWYPKKEAFLTGRVLVESPDSVGTNALVTGYESKAIGDYSQAMGYKCVARGDYSHAIGDSSLAIGNYSVSMGHMSASEGKHSLALGWKCMAKGTGAIALGRYATADGGLSISIGHVSQTLSLIHI